MDDEGHVCTSRCVYAELHVWILYHLDSFRFPMSTLLWYLVYRTPITEVGIEIDGQWCSGCKGYKVPLLKPLSVGIPKYGIA